MLAYNNDYAVPSHVVGIYIVILFSSLPFFTWKSQMPYWSIGEWRACIGSSWCALGRPFKMRSPFRGKTQRDLMLSQGVAALFLLIMSIGINLWLRALVASEHHLPLLSE